MLSLLRPDPEVQRKTNECREQIRVLKAAIEKKISGYDLEVLKGYHADHPLPPDAESNRAPNFRVRQRLNGHFGKIYALHWSSNSNDIVSASQDGKLLVWDAHSTNKKVAIPLRSAWVMTCAFSPNGQQVASGGLDNLCSVFKIGENLGWEITTPELELQAHEGYLSCCRFVGDSKILTSSGDGTIMLWDLQRTQKAERVFEEHLGDVQSVCVHPTDRQQFASGAIDAQAKTWDMRQQGKCTASFVGHESDINDVKWFPDGKSIVSGSDDSTCRMFDTAAHRQLAMYGEEQSASAVTEVDFTKSGRFLVVGYDEEPYCVAWDTLSGDRAFNLMHQNRASCVQVSPDGKALATGCWDKVVRIWA